MAFTSAALNAGADAIAALAGYVSLHTADPTTVGDNEVSGGSPAYARKAVTWGAASAGDKVGSQVTFDVPAGTFTHAGYWTASTGGTFLGGNALNTSQTLGTQGQIRYSPTIDLD